MPPLFHAALKILYIKLEINGSMHSNANAFGACLIYRYSSLPKYNSITQDSCRILKCKFKDSLRTIQGLKLQFSRSSNLTFTKHA